MDLLKEAAGENETSHVLAVTHNLLVVGELKKEQVQIFSFLDQRKLVIVTRPPSTSNGTYLFLF